MFDRDFEREYDYEYDYEGYKWYIPKKGETGIVSDIKEIVARTVEENGLLEKGDGIVVAVSGGADSVALLRFLEGEKERCGLDLVVAHFNHHLRGKASDGDEEFVSSMAGELGLPFRCGGGDARKEAEKRGASVEDVARDLRYDFLLSVAGEEGARALALGHTADDLAETFLMRLLRGAGLDGLVPMEPLMRRGRLRVIRPLLDVRHAQVVRHLKEASVPYRLDRSNFSSSYFRNRVRLELIPALQRGYNPAAGDAMARAARSLAEARDYIEGEVARELENRVEEGDDFISLRLSGLHPAVASGVVRSVLRSRSIPYSRDRIEEIISIAVQGRGGVDLGGPFRAVAEGEELLLLKVGDVNSFPPAPVNVPGKTVAGRFDVETSFAVQAPIERDSPDLARTWKGAFEGARVTCEAYLDYGSLEEPLVLRGRRHGDRFQPTGMGRPRKLKDILIDEKVPRRLRDGIPIFVSGDELVWVVGYRLGERFKVRRDSRKILKIKVTAEGKQL